MSGPTGTPGAGDPAPEVTASTAAADEPAAAAPGGLVDDVRALLSALVALAKLELATGAKAKATGAGMLAATAALASLAVKALLVAAGAALALVMPVWAAALVVAGVLLVIGAVLVLVARPKLATPVSADAAKEEAQETVRILRERLGRS